MTTGGANLTATADLQVFILIVKDVLLGQGTKILAGETNLQDISTSDLAKDQIQGFVWKVQQRHRQVKKE